MRDHRSTGAAPRGREPTIGWIGVALTLILLMVGITAHVIAAPPAPEPALLDPKTVPMWENQLNGPPPVYVPDTTTYPGIDYYEVNASEFTEQILPPSMGLQTTVWGYGGHAKDAVSGTDLGFIRNSPAPSFRVERNTTSRVKWINNLTNPHLFAVDPTIMWADPNNLDMGGMGSMLGPPFLPFPPGYNDAQRNVPMIPHVHGAEVQSTSDGFPLAWFTANGTQGPKYHTVDTTDGNAAIFEYPNTQQPGTIWYHDHAMGMTRLNVMSGLAGYYFIRDANDPIEPLLPQGEFEMPIAIQDRIFYANGSLFFPTVGDNPDIHPYWQPEFFGDTIMVNGKVWPNMNVKQGTYRFHLLDGSNARFYTLSFSNNMRFTQIGTDGGYLKTAAELKELTIAPGERADILVDFSKLPVGTRVTLKNSAKAPFPAGTKADPQTVGQIVQFTVTGPGGPAFPALPTELNPTLAGATFPNLPEPSVTRIMTLQEVQGPGGPVQILLDGQPFGADVSETPKNGATEEWVIVDTTMDTHPIHLHLVQFQLESRQGFQSMKYEMDWLALNGEPPLDHPTIALDPTPYLQGKPSGPRSSELGWKDTVQMNPGEVTKIRVRWTAQDGSPFQFDPTVGPGYVWHCHIIDHEDNEMMRPYKVLP